MVISAQLQDAVLHVGDIAYLPCERRLAAVGNRFDWVDTLRPINCEPKYVRRQTALRFERVLNAKVQGIDLQRKDAVLSLMAIGFEPDGEPDNPAAASSSTSLVAPRSAFRWSVSRPRSRILGRHGASNPCRGTPTTIVQRSARREPVW